MEGENISKVEVNANEGAQINIAFGNGTIYAEQNNRNKDIIDRSKIKSRTQEYADKWNQNMFLNNFDKRDENAGVNVKLSEVYLEEHLPHYIWGENQKISTDLKDILKEYIYPYYENKMLLILGQPGIGKSTLITWITANFTDKADDILVYRFASDLRDFDWQSARLLNRILEKLGLDYQDLNRKTIILDGLDEVSINNRREVLDGLYDNVICENRIKEFSLIITCRENYVQERERIRGKYIILQPWDVIQIRSFCDVFQESTKNNLSDSTIEKLFENREILGIPLILYMVLALNISIEKEGSLVDVYDRIFALDGGIYDRCINNRRFADKHRIGEIKKQIHQISRDIAIWMFENNSEEANISQQEYQKICVNVMHKQEQNNGNLAQDFLIGNFFKLVKHCEGLETETLYFVHRTIYEYFVAETIYSSMRKINISIENLAGIFGNLLKRNNLSETILQYLKNKIGNERLNNLFDRANEAFQLMLRDGMTYYTGMCYKNAFHCEMYVFTNMLEILHLWEKDCYNYNIEDLKCNFFNNRIDYGKFNFSKTNLSNSKLYKTNLQNINMCRSNLIGADLREANLRNADLRFSNLHGADLTRADLTGANLKGTNLCAANLRFADLKLAKMDYNTCVEKTLIEDTIIDVEQMSYWEKQIDISKVKVYNRKRF